MWYVHPAGWFERVQASVTIVFLASQVVSDSGGRKTISDDQDIYSAKQKLPKRVLSKVQVSVAWMQLSH